MLLSTSHGAQAAGASEVSVQANSSLSSCGGSTGETYRNCSPTRGWHVRSALHCEQLQGRPTELPVEIEAAVQYVVAHIVLSLVVPLPLGEVARCSSGCKRAMAPIPAGVFAMQQGAVAILAS